MEFKQDESCKLIIVEGNISAGKSTLCKALSEGLGYVLYLEPTVENPFLGPYYKNPKKYALPMQLWLLKQRFVTYLKAWKFSLETSGETKGVILDRSIWSDIVFAEKNYLDGNFSRKGYEYYLELRAKLLDGLPEPHGVVYLDTKAEVCFDRIHKMRQRECEDGIPLEYLAGLDKCYRNFVAGMRETRAKVASIDWNTFGAVDDVIEFIKDMACPPPAEWVPEVEHLSTLINDPAAVDKAMVLDYTIDEAGADIEVADPDWITTKEVRVMPSSPGTPEDRMSTPSPDTDRRPRLEGASPLVVRLEMGEGVRGED